MKNHWLNNTKSKKIFKEIDDYAMDVWGDDGTFGDFINGLNKEQRDFLFAMTLKDFAGDLDEMTFGFETEGK